jgi:hypothetical protein
MSSSGPELGNVDHGLVEYAESALSARGYSLSNSARDLLTQIRDSWRAADRQISRSGEPRSQDLERTRQSVEKLVIGLTFETGIKRQVPTKRTQGSSVSQVVNRLYKNRQRVDQLFDRLSHVSEPLTASSSRKSWKFTDYL